MKITIEERIQLEQALETVTSLQKRLADAIQEHNKIPFPLDESQTDEGDMLKFQLKDVNQLRLQLDHVTETLS